MNKERHYARIVGVVGLLLLQAAPAHATAQASELLIQQFVRVDSLFAVLASQPESGSDDSLHTDALLGAVIKEYRAFFALARTNSHGHILGQVANEGVPGFDEERVAESNWFRNPAKSRKPFYGKLERTDERFSLIWSRPVLIRNALGISRFDGVVVARVNVAECIRDFGKVYKAPFELLFEKSTFFRNGWVDSKTYEEEPIGLMGDVEFVLRHTPARGEFAGDDGPATVPPAARSARSLESSTDSHVTNLEMTSPVEKQPFRSVILKLLLPALAGGGIWSVIVTARRRKKNRISDAEREKITAEESDRVRKIVIAQIYCEIKTQIVKHESRRIEKDVREQIHKEVRDQLAPTETENVRNELRNELAESVRQEVCSELRSNILDRERSALEAQVRHELRTGLLEKLRTEKSEEIEQETLDTLRSECRERVANELEASIREQVIGEFTERIRLEVEKSEHALLLVEARGAVCEKMQHEIEAAEGAAIRDMIRAELKSAFRSGILESEVDTLTESARGMLRDEIKSELSSREADRIIEQERTRLAAEIRSAIEQKYLGEIEQDVKDTLRDEFAAKIRDSESEEIAQRERDLIASKIRKEIVDSIAELTAQVRQQVTNEVREKIAADEGQQISDAVRAEIEGEYRKLVLENSSDEIAKEQRGQIEKEIYEEISVSMRTTLRNRLLAEIGEEERARIDRDDRQNLIENERRRIIEEESSSLRDMVRDEIRIQERAIIREEVFREVREHETSEIAHKLEASFAERVHDEASIIGRQIGEELRDETLSSLRRQHITVMQRLSSFSAKIENIESLRSLQQTLQLMNLEMEKYRYFNLNAKQTKSMVEYLNRLYAQLNTFFDELTGTVKGVKDEMTSLMAKAGGQDSDLTDETCREKVNTDFTHLDVGYNDTVMPAQPD